MDEPGFLASNQNDSWVLDMPFTQKSKLFGLIWRLPPGGMEVMGIESACDCSVKDVRIIGTEIYNLCKSGWRSKRMEAL